MSEINARKILCQEKFGNNTYGIAMGTNGTQLLYFVEQHLDNGKVCQTAGTDHVALCMAIGVRNNFLQLALEVVTGRKIRKPKQEFRLYPKRILRRKKNNEKIT